MPQDKILRNCLLVSILVHGVFIFTNLHLRGIFPKITSPQKIEVTYFREPPSQKIARLPDNLLAGAKNKITIPAAKANEKMLKPALKTSKAAAGVRKVTAPKTAKLSTARSVILPTKDIASDKVLVSYNSKDLSSEPSYLRYHNIIRAKIEKMANENKPYIFKVGEVNLIFTILNSGDLKSVALAKTSSAADPQLRKCAIDSVYAASPFPPFTGDIKEDYLTFQVPISFEK